MISRRLPLDPSRHASPQRSELTHFERMRFILIDAHDRHPAFTGHLGSSLSIGPPDMGTISGTQC
jgi:hypothetical protein